MSTFPLFVSHNSKTLTTLAPTPTTAQPTIFPVAAAALFIPPPPAVVLGPAAPGAGLLLSGGANVACPKLALNLSHHSPTVEESSEACAEGQ